MTLNGIENTGLFKENNANENEFHGKCLVTNNQYRNWHDPMIPAFHFKVNSSNLRPAKWTKNYKSFHVKFPVQGRCDFDNGGRGWSR